MDIYGIQVDMTGFTSDQAKIEAMRIVLRFLIMDVAFMGKNTTDEGIRMYISKLHEAASEHIEKLNVRNRSNADAQDVKSAIESQIDQIFSGLGIPAAK
ncbi:hypothetical protein [Rhizobium sp. 60-20]|uniref:hypothetical protein n=1 Tax=Rhizobium sp. 60-20 TaxID=1895819 RepID=UPI000928EBB6|nr:hypothetical protein [Rhizobium sp. 60-20]OJY66443.1 MAG: hypothetical protein BGP09_31455 [Rhizobium sp. 60-20]